jgi:NADH-quinone oxidoreductase subunit C
VVDPLSETTETEEQPQALPGDGLREGIVDDLRRRIGDAIVDTHISPNDDLWVRVRTDAWRETAEALHAAGFTFFSFLSALDWLPSPYGKGEEDPTAEPVEPDTDIRQGVTGGDTRFQVFARLVDLDRHVGVTVKADVPDDHPVVDSWTTVYSGANWHEREAHEMFGIGFNGHPDLRTMYLPTDFEGFPLRKDFPLLARMIKPWPGIVDVEPMPEQGTAGEGSASDEPDAARGESAAADEPAISEESDS